MCVCTLGCDRARRALQAAGLVHLEQILGYLHLCMNNSSFISFANCYMCCTLFYPIQAISGDSYI